MDFPWDVAGFFNLGFFSVSGVTLTVLLTDGCTGVVPVCAGVVLGFKFCLRTMFEIFILRASVFVPTVQRWL